MTASDPEQTVRELVEADRAALLMTQPFLALLALRLTVVPVPDDQISTVATDAEHLFCSVRFAASATPAERRHLVAHAVWHLALLHPWRRAGRNRDAWDRAIDHEVNALLEAHQPLPDGSFLLPDLAGQSTEQVYRSLVELPRLPERGQLCDVHLDPESRPELRAQTEARWHEHVLAAAQQLSARGLELLPAVARLVESLRRPTVPWRSVLAEFVVSAFGDRRQWLPPNRRFLHQSLYLPRRRSERLELALALDTSASTRARQADFWAEILGVVEAYDDYDLCLVQGDDQVRQVHHHSRASPIDPRKIELSGFSGTDFRPIFAHLAQAPQPPRALVFLTDGEGQAPRSPPPYPVLWVLTARGRTPASWGQVLRLPIRDNLG